MFLRVHNHVTGGRAENQYHAPAFGDAAARYCRMCVNRRHRNSRARFQTHQLRGLFRQRACENAGRQHIARDFGFVEFVETRVERDEKII